MEETYSGLDITWSGLDIQESYTYEGDGEWIGQRSEQMYDSYGNLVREVESAWAPQSSTWQDLPRAARGYYPNVSAGTYLVGLAGWQNRYACPAGYTNGKCSENYAYPNNPPSTWAQSSITYLYDNHTSGQQPPSQGILSGQRSFLYWASPPSSDARFRDESYAYDAWGNLTEQRVYTGEGSEAQYGVGNPQVTSSSYDATYHTYRISESNALGQATTWSYDSNCGMPVSETGPNGAASSISASYDNYCRLEQVVRPGDSSSYPTLSVEYHDEAQPYWIEVRQRIEAGSGLERIHREIYDGLGRIVQAQSGAAVLADNACSQDSDSAEDVCDIKADTTFDGNGRVNRQSVPYAAAAWNGVGNPWNGQRPQPTRHADELRAAGAGAKCACPRWQPEQPDVPGWRRQCAGRLRLPGKLPDRRRRTDDLHAPGRIRADPAGAACARTSGSLRIRRQRPTGRSANRRVVNQPENTTRLGERHA